MAITNSPATAIVNSVALSSQTTGSPVPLPDYDKQRVEDVGFLTAMTLTLLGNYAQTGHFGGPLAYTPYTVTSHLIGPELGGLRFDYRRPKHPYADKFMLAGGHNDTSSELVALRKLREDGKIDSATADKILDRNARTLYGL